MPRLVHGDRPTLRGRLHCGLALAVCVALAACGSGTVSDDEPTGDPAAGDPGADPGAGDPSAGDPDAGDPDAGDPGEGDPDPGDPGDPDPVTLAISSATGVVRLTWANLPAAADELVLFAGPSDTELTELARPSLGATQYDDATVTEATRLYRLEARGAGSPLAQSTSVSTATLPTTSITALAGDAWTSSNDPTLALTGTDDEGVAGFERRLDGGAWTSSSATAQLANLLVGNHVLEARARDGDGNLDPTPVSYTFALNVDFAASITLERGASHTRATTIELTLQARDAVEVIFGEDPELTDGTLESFQPTAFWPLSANDGPKTLYARFYDDAGNASSIVSADVTLDTTAPTLQLSAPVADAVFGVGTFSVTGDVQDDSPVTVTIDDVPVSLSGDAFSEDASRADGTHLIEIVATDLAGNSTVVTRSVRVDLVAPVVTVSEPAAGLYTRADSVIVRGTATDVSATAVTIEGVEAQRTGNEFLAFAVPLADGDNTITISATDALGRNTTLDLLVVRDVVPPATPVTTTVTPRAGGVTLCGTAEPGVQVVAAAGGQTVNAAADGEGEWCAELSGQELLDVALTAVDAAGNASATLAASLDTAAPSSPVLVPITSPTSRRAIVVYGYAEPGATVEITGGLETATGRARLDTGFFFVGVQLRTNRVNQLSVRAVDAAGNGSATATLGVRQDEVAPAPARRVFLSQGQSQRALINSAAALPIQVVAVDAARAPIPGASVEFTVVGGGGSVAGLASTTVQAGPDGLVAVPFALGPSITEEDNLVLVDIDGNGGAPVLVEATGFAPSPATPTRVSGIVLDNALEPVVNARVAMGGLSTVTGGDGRFAMVVGNMLGPQHLVIDPALALGIKKYPPMTHVLEVLPGQDNQLGKPVFLPEVDVNSTAAVSPTSGGVTQSAEMPDLSVSVGAGSVTFPGGATSGEVFVSPVPSNRVPMPLTGGFASNAVISVLPKDALFDPPAAVTFPNADGLAPGARVDVVSFDHDLGRYMVVGSGSVSEDGSVVRSDPGSGIRRGAWHASAPRGSSPTTSGSGSGSDASGAAAPSGSNARQAERNASMHADPVNLATGELIVDETDLSVPGRGVGFGFRRTYRSRSRDADGPLGAGWYHNFQTRVITPRPRCEVFSAGGTSAVLRNDLSFFLANIPLTNATTRLQVEGSCRQAAIDGATIELLVASGQREAYSPTAAGRWIGPPGRYTTLERVEDGPVRFVLRERGGAASEFDSFGRLLRQRDRNGNALHLWWDDQDRLRVVTDPFGRAVRFTYDVNGRITRVTDDTQRAVSYIYDARGDLVSVSSPTSAGAAATTRATYQYAAGGPATPELAHNLVRVTDALGNVLLQNRYGAAPGTYDYDKVVEQQWNAGTVTLSYEARAAGGNFTRMVDRNGNIKDYLHDAAGHELEVREYTNRGIGAQPVVVTRKEYNAAGELTRVVLPRGNSIEYTYDEQSADPRARGNLLEVRRKNGALGGGADLVSRTTYEASFQLPATITDPRGLVSSYTYDARGNLTREDRPTLTRDDGTTLPVVWRYESNAFGQRTKLIDAEGNVTNFLYHPETDPEGDGQASARPGLDATTGGFAREIVVDAETHADRSSPVAPRVRRTQLRYDALGRPAGDVDALGATYATTFDARGNPTRRVDPLGHATEWSYDANGELVEKRVEIIGGETDSDFPGGVLRQRTVHDAYGRAIEVGQQISGGTYATSLASYDANDNLIRSVSPAGVTTEHTYDELGRVVVETAAPGTALERTSQLRYDANGNLVERIDALGERLTHEYDGFDRRVRTCLPLGTCTSYEYDAAGQVVSEETTDVAGNVMARVDLERDEQGSVRRRSAELLDGTNATSTSSVTYNRLGQVTRTRHDDGVEERLTRDGTGAVTRRELVGGATETLEYDAVGRLSRRTVTETSAVAGTTRVLVFSYVTDLLGRVTAETHPTEGTSLARFDSAGRLVESTDARGISRLRKLDGRGLVTEMTLDAGTPSNVGLGSAGDGVSVWRFTYDDDGRTTSSTTPSEGTRSFVYDAIGQLARVTYPDSSAIDYTYDLRGALVREEQPGGTVLASTRDAEGRVTRLDATLGAGVVGPTSTTYGYDALGRLTQASVGAHTVTRTWDGLSRMLSESQDGRVVRSAWNRAGARTGLTYPGGEQLDYALDALGRMRAASGDVFSGVIGDDPIGNSGLVRRQLPSGAELAWRFDAQGRVDQVRYDQGATVLAGERYVLGPVNDVRAVSRLHEGGAGDVMVYDGAGRLTAQHEDVADVDAALADPEAATASRRWRFGFDDAFQLRSINAGAGASALDVRNDGAITAVGATVRTYDARGNLASDGARTFAYDAQGRLAEIRAVGTGDLLVGYTYDALGRLIERSAGGATTRLVYDGGAILELRDGSDTTQWRFARRGAEILAAQDATGSAYFPMLNRGGDLIGWTDETGTVVERIRYSPYGLPSFTADDGTPTASLIPLPPAQAGATWDPEAALYALPARHYDPAVGAMLQRDPAQSIIFGGSALYQFALGDPVNYGDPTGLDPKKKGFGWLDGLNLTLDAIGVFGGPLVGGIADALSGLIYAARDQWVDAGISGASALMAGKVANAARLTARVSAEAGGLAAGARTGGDAAIEARVMEVSDKNAALLEASKGPLNNCGMMCVNAGEAIRGTPPPGVWEATLKETKLGGSGWDVSQIEAHFGSNFGPRMTNVEAKAAMEAAPNGSNFAIYARNPWDPTVGHSFNAYKDSTGAVRWVDTSAPGNPYAAGSAMIDAEIFGVFKMMEIK